MKNRILYLLPFALLLGGCFKSANDTPPTPIPNGTFTGTFRLLHRPNTSVVFDTLKANITLTMNSSNFTYAVTGDTATVHAGSKGVWGLSGNYAIFTDQTFPKTGVPTKTHLNGGYVYYYDGSIFQMIAEGAADTLSLQYDLKKSSTTN
ncbi:MAG TPA: hypothetical protein VHE59_10745 [Mucilaginibacter sp.]|nr:hypothetical protein [Mucilaginibacter sp.]